MLVLSMATGLGNQLGLFEGTTLALLGMDRIKWTAPVRPGDTIHVEFRVKEKKPSSKPDRGVLTVEVTVKNQREEPGMSAEWTTLMARKGSG
jgi:acyl dehydratase